MQRLAEIQSGIRDAVVAGDAAGIGSMLVGGGDGRMRLQIHRRHYVTSLVNAIVEKFPATGWLVGTRFLTEAARQYVPQHPPGAPCIAEYGAGFPRFLSECPGAERVPYLPEFAQLEWHVGHVAIAIDEPAVSMEELAAIPANSLPDVRLTLQPGLRYFHASWLVDELMKLYLAEAAPEQFEFEPANAWIEVRGARGEFNINPLDQAEFVFRERIVQRQSIAAAAECALDADAAFDAGKALAMLIASNLVIAVTAAARSE
jgi:hypothetical protein